MSWHKTDKGFRSPEGMSYKIKDESYMSVEGIVTEYSWCGAVCSLEEVPYAILNMHYGRFCLEYVKNIFTGHAVKVAKIIDPRMFRSDKNETLDFEDYSFSTKYQPVRCMQTGQVMPKYLVKDSYRLPGELGAGDVVKRSNGELQVVVSTSGPLPTCLLTDGATSYPKCLEYVGRAELLTDGSYMYQGLSFGRSLNRHVCHQIDKPRMLHMLFISLIDSEGRLVSQITGDWVPFNQVASVENHRAFHPEYLVAGLPQKFKVEE